MVRVVKGGTARLGTLLHPLCWLYLCPYPRLFPQSYEDQELLRLIYYGGIQHEIRKAVWPFLLGHYQFGMTEAERKEVGEGVLPAQQPGVFTGVPWSCPVEGAVCRAHPVSPLGLMSTLDWAVGRSLNTWISRN